MKITSFIFFALLFFIVGVSNVQAQSKNSIKIGVGPSASAGTRTLGLGWIMSLGYQREFNNDRLRFNPNLTFGMYTNKEHDTINAYFNSVSFHAIMYADLIRLNKVSLVLGAGPVINNSRGAGVNSGFPHTTPFEYFNEFHFGVFGIAGIRINDPDRKIAYEIFPLYVQRASGVHTEFGSKVGIDVKF